MSAIAILSELRRNSVTVRLDGDNLRLRPAPGIALAPDLISRVKEASPALLALLAAQAGNGGPPADNQFTRPLVDFDERAAIAEFDGCLPRQIADGMARLQTAQPLPGFSPVRWLDVIYGAARFADAWGAKALALGWEPIELFGVDRAAPAARLDTRGLAFMLADCEVVAMDAEVAVIRNGCGIKTRYWRWQVNSGSVVAWELGRG